MNNQVLSIEQCKELVSMSIDMSNASMCYFIDVIEELVPIYSPVGYSENEYIPTFTLQDILEILPKHLNVKDKTYFLTLMYDITGIVITYCTEHIRDILHSEGNSNQLNAAFNMLKWCKQNKHI